MAKTLTVADLIRALQKLPSDMEVWADIPSGFEYEHPALSSEITSNSEYGFCVDDGKLWVIYDTYRENAQLLDFGDDV